MISAARKKIRNVVMLGILGFALIAIVITGFGTDGMGGLGSGGSTGPSAQTLVTVGSEKVTDAEASQDLERFFRDTVRENPTLDRAQFIDANFAPFFEALVERRSLVAFARSLGFVVPESLVIGEIIKIPAFRNAAGQFDNNTYQQVLESVGMTDQKLRKDIEQQLLVRMVSDPVVTGSRLPQAIAREYATLLLERRSGQVGAVSTEALARGLNPSDQEVAAFYQQNQRSFALPERRVIRFALLGREQLGEAVRATDQEIQAHYQQNQAQYGPGETRNVLIFTTQDQAAVQQFVQRVRSGTSFIDAARAAGFAPEDVSFQNQSREQVSQRSDANFANALFGAQPGALIGPQQTATGFQVAQVQTVNRTAGRPLESVRGEIAAAIEQRKLAEQLNALVERIQGRLDEGASFEEVAQAERLNVQTSPPVAANGQGANFQFPQDLAPVLQTAFDMAPEDDPQLQVIQPDQRAAIVALGNVLPSAAPPLAEIRDQVRARLIRQTAAQRARAVAQGIADKINRGMAPDQAYAQAGVPVPPRQPVSYQRLQLVRGGIQVPPPVVRLFSIPQGRASIIEAPNGAGWLIVHHQQRTPGNLQADRESPQLVQAMQRQLGETGDDELREQFARAVRNSMGVQRNEDAISGLRQRLRTGR